MVAFPQLTDGVDFFCRCVFGKAFSSGRVNFEEIDVSHIGLLVVVGFIASHCIIYTFYTQKAIVFFKIFVKFLFTKQSEINYKSGMALTAFLRPSSRTFA